MNPADWLTQPCALCRSLGPTVNVRGTDDRICIDCALDRPVELVPEVAA